MISHSGIEFHGNLYISDELSMLPINCKELWIKAKLEKDNQDNRYNEYIAKILHTKEKLKCVYDKKTEDIIASLQKKIHVL